MYLGQEGSEKKPPRVTREIKDTRTDCNISFQFNILANHGFRVYGKLVASIALDSFSKTECKVRGNDNIGGISVGGYDVNEIQTRMHAIGVRLKTSAVSKVLEPPKHFQASRHFKLHIFCGNDDETYGCAWCDHDELDSDSSISDVVKAVDQPFCSSRFWDVNDGCTVYFQIGQWELWPRICLGRQE